MGKKRKMILACAVILLCVCMVVGGTYILMSDSLTSKTHLVAGDLDIGLKRTNLVYTELNKKGYLTVKTDDSDVDFTEPTKGNVFGLDDKMLMIPGSYFEAEMQLTNIGSVAFDYSVQIQLDKDFSDDDFADQLRVQIYKRGEDPAGQGWMKMSDLIGESGKYTGTHIPAQSNETFDFIVRVEFVDYDDDGETNNKAQGQEVKFDLIVTAIQSTTAPDANAVTQ